MGEIRTVDIHQLALAKWQALVADHRASLPFEGHDPISAPATAGPMLLTVRAPKMIVALLP
jgi:hypothetical protein